MVDVALRWTQGFYSPAFKGGGQAASNGSIKMLRGLLGLSFQLHPSTLKMIPSLKGINLSRNQNNQPKALTMPLGFIKMKNKRIVGSNQERE